MGRKFTFFALFYFVCESKFHVQAPRGAYIQRSDLTEGFLHYDFEGLIFGGAHTWRGLFSEFYGRYEPYLVQKSLYPFDVISKSTTLLLTGIESGTPTD